MKTKSKSSHHNDWWKIATLSLVVLASVYFIWQYMFVKNSQKSEAAGCSNIGKECTTKRCCQGLKEVNILGQCRCMPEKVDNCVTNGGTCVRDNECCGTSKCALIYRSGRKICLDSKIIDMLTKTPPQPGDDCDGSCLVEDTCFQKGGDPIPGTCIGGKVCCELPTVPKPTTGSCSGSYSCVSQIECDENGGTVKSGICTGGRVCCDL